MSERKVGKWIESALKNQDLIDYEINVNGKTGKEDGYLGNIFFVTVSGKTKSGIPKRVDLVLKSSKECDILRNQAPVKEAFEKEIFIYEEVKTAFEEFQRDQGIVKILEIIPKCYGTRITDTNELLILEDLKSKGFGLWDRKKMMSSEQVKLVLEAYGKWHALAVALKKERPEKFEKLIENNKNIFSLFVTKGKMVDYFLNIFIITRDAVIASDGVDISKHLQLSRNDIEYIFGDMLFEDPNYHVILHGDCWNNNFLFKFKEDESEVTDVRIIDWQCSGLGSPIFDLSDFIYGCCDVKTYPDINELLNIYYKSFSEYLKQLNCDSGTIFPFEKLQEHWQRFAIYGILVSGFNLKFCLCEADDAPDFAETAESGLSFVDNFNFKITNEGEYFERMRNNLIHYVNNLIK